MNISTSRVIVFGASGKLGTTLVQKLSAMNYPVVAVSRKLSIPSLPHVTVFKADLNDPNTFKNLIQTQDYVINAAHACFTEHILANLPIDIRLFINIGSMRYLTKFQNPAAQQVRQAMALMNDCPGPWVMFHPTMIYGSKGENNIQRIAKIIKKFGIIPLPDQGKSLIQPIYSTDVVAYILKSLTYPHVINQHIHIAGPQALSYAHFIKAIGNKLGIKAKIVSLPLSLLYFLCKLTKIIPGVPRIHPDEIQRLTENKEIDIKHAQNIFKINLTPLEQGLMKTFTNVQHNE